MNMEKKLTLQLLTVRMSIIMRGTNTYTVTIKKNIMITMTMINTGSAPKVPSKYVR